MNQGFAGLFSVLLLLSIILIGTGVIGSELWNAQDDIQKLNDEITRLTGDITQRDAQIQALQARIDEALRGREAAEAETAELIDQLAASEAERDRLARQVQELATRLAAAQAQLQAAQAGSGMPGTGDAASGNAPRSTGPLEMIESDPIMVGATWMVIFFSGALVASVMMFINQRVRRPAAEPAAPHGASPANPNGHQPRAIKTNQQEDPRAMYAPEKTEPGCTLTPAILTRRNNGKGDSGKEVWINN